MKIDFKKSLVSIAIAQTFTAQAATITVNDLGDVSQDDLICTLREAIDSANNNPVSPSSGCVGGSTGLDSVVFAPSVTGTISLIQDARLELNETVTITGPGQDQLTIDASGNNGHRVFVSFSGGTSVFNISEVTLHGASIVGGNGGGIYVRDDTELNLTNVTVSGNTAGNSGGGIFVGGNAEAQLINCTVSGNYNGARGGGISLGSQAKVELTDTIVSSNTAGSKGGGAYVSDNANLTITRGSVTLNKTETSSGAGIYVKDSGQVALLNTTISLNVSARNGGGVGIRGTSSSLTSSDTSWLGNSGRYGGAISPVYGSGDGVTVQIDRDTFRDNTASSQGGAIRARDVAKITINDSSFYENKAGTLGGALTIVASAQLNLNRSVVFNNTADLQGGGISGSYLTVSNSTISGNFALSDGNGRGGGILSSGPLTIINSTIVGNNATNFGGGLSISSATPPPIIVNTIIAGNESASGSEVSFSGGGTLISDASNLLGSSASDTAQAFLNFAPGASDINATSDTLGTPFTLASIVGELADNDGPTVTHALPDESPAIDAGDQSLCDFNEILTDQRLVKRDNGCDIGAFEKPSSSSIFVVPTKDGAVIFEL